MRGSRWGTWVLVAGTCAAAAAPGCHGASKRSRSAEPGLAVPAEPTLGAPIEPGASVTPGASTAPGISWVDRHPLLTKPKEWYDTTNSDSKFVKGLAATVIGVPAGVLGEMRQIVTGSPPATKY